MKERVRSFLQREGISGKILLALSGGRDSLALLSVLAELARENDSLSLAVGHFNHKSRGAESESDEDFVKKLCGSRLFQGLSGYDKESALPCFIGSAPVLELAKERKQGFEETARQLRYDFLEETAQKIGANHIATAHHGEDNLETFLLNLCRGSGLRGLSAIPPRRGRMIRPFLEVSRQEINDYIQEQQISFREDASNAEEVYRRNFIRHQVLGKLEEVNPQYLAHSMNTIRIIREEDNFLEGLVASSLPVKKEEERVLCSLADFRKLDPVLQPRALRYFTGQMGHRLSGGQGRECLRLLQEKAPFGEIFLCQHLRLVRSYDTIVCEHASANTAIQGTRLVEGDFSWNGWGISCEIKAFSGEEALSPLCFPLPFGEDLFLRPRKEGDRLTVGGRCSKTIKKWCIDQKIPRPDRDTLPVFVTEKEEVLAVGGLGCNKIPHIGEKIVWIRLRRIQ